MLQLPIWFETLASPQAIPQSLAAIIDSAKHTAEVKSLEVSDIQSLHRVKTASLRGLENLGLSTIAPCGIVSALQEQQWQNSSSKLGKWQECETSLDGRGSWSGGVPAEICECCACTSHWGCELHLMRCLQFRAALCGEAKAAVAAKEIECLKGSHTLCSTCTE